MLQVCYCRPQRSCGKVMFSPGTVILFTGEGGGGMCGRGSMCSRGHALQGGMHGRGCARWGGMCGRGCAWQGSCVEGGHVWWGVCMAGETATAVYGTHPTGMHSCLFRSSHCPRAICGILCKDNLRFSDHQMFLPA